VPAEDLRHAHDAGFGKRDRPVAVLALSRAKFIEVFLDLKGDAQRPVREQAVDRVLGPGLPGQQAHRLRQHRLADQ
jgi:hypothetical protein